MELKVLRDGKEIWKNYKEEPQEDKQVYFEYSFKDKDGKKLIIPAKAHSSSENNIEAKESKTFTYKGLELKISDVVKATMFVRFSKKDCQSVVKLEDKKYNEPHILKEVTYTVEGK